jgi:hypothetical protein
VVPGPAPTANGIADPAAGPLGARLRRAAAQTVQQLSFPMGLAIAIFGFLVVQHRVDLKDPRVADPSLSADDELMGFS